MPSKPPSKTVAIIKIASGDFLFFAQVSTETHGLVPLVNRWAVGFDIWGVAVYAFCLWAVVTGIRTLAVAKEPRVKMRHTGRRIAGRGR
jgi:hypothetical protein